MGRNLKTVIAADKSDRREIGYYSTPGFVAEFFARRILELRPGAHFVFDPCIGRGEFVSGDFLGLLMNRNSTPLFFEEPKHNIDVIVANPPYNCHEVDYIRRNKAQLAARFGKAATLNMYALFMRAVLDYAPDGCLIGFVTYDSFLTAAGHHELRRLIIDTCVIHNLHLCPTNLFLDQGADVRTCLLILEKRRRHSVRTKVSNRPASTSEFQDILYGEKPFRECAIQDLLLADSRDKSEFIIDVPSEIADLFHEKRLCEIAPCVTESPPERTKNTFEERSPNALPFRFIRTQRAGSFMLGRMAFYAQITLKSNGGYTISS